MNQTAGAWQTVGVLSLSAEKGRGGSGPHGTSVADGPCLVCVVSWGPHHTCGEGAVSHFAADEGSERSCALQVWEGRPLTVSLLAGDGVVLWCRRSYFSLRSFSVFVYEMGRAMLPQSAAVRVEEVMAC